MNFNLNLTRFTAPALNCDYRLLPDAALAHHRRSVKVIAGSVTRPRSGRVTATAMCSSGFETQNFKYRTNDDG